MKTETIELIELRPHEEIEPLHLEELREEIRSDKILKKPIVVDKKTMVILDGHHRFNSFKQLGLSKIPVYFVDYASSLIKVTGWKDGSRITKKQVREAGSTGRKLPARTSKHMYLEAGELVHISEIVTNVNVPLENLR
ncbi:MAG: ParB N-terminal domain-containing protein [Nitrososphaerales archaeon]